MQTLIIAVSAEAIDGLSITISSIQGLQNIAEMWVEKM